MLYFNITKSHPATQAFSPLSSFPRRQPPVLITKVTVGDWLGNSYQSPSPLWPQESGWPYLLLRQNHKIWSFEVTPLPQMPTVNLPEQQQNRWTHLSFQVDFYCYYGTIQSYSTSLYLITVINLKSLLFDIGTKVIPGTEPCQGQSTNPCQLPFLLPCKQPAWSFLSETAGKEIKQVLSCPPSPEEILTSSSLFKGKPHAT